MRDAGVVTTKLQGADSSAGAGAGISRASQPDATTLVELLFFAYRDFVGEPDRVLARFGFGRAHHRVLHFVNRNPGLTIAALLEILGITKQSLARVLRDLVDGSFIEQRAGTKDRRQRRLHVTGQGEALAEELLSLQTRRVGRALAEVAPEARPGIALFLEGLIDVRGPEVQDDAVVLASRGSGGVR